MRRDIRELSEPKIHTESIGSVEEVTNHRYHPRIAAEYKPITDTLSDQAKVTEAFFKEVRMDAIKRIALRVALLAAGAMMVIGISIGAYPFALVTAAAFTALGIASAKQLLTQAAKDTLLSDKAKEALFEWYPFTDRLATTYPDQYFTTFLITQDVD